MPVVDGRRALELRRPAGGRARGASGDRPAALLFVRAPDAYGLGQRGKAAAPYG